MNLKLLKRLHLVGTLWFMVCVGFILTLALHEAGFNSWVIFTLSGHSLVVFFLLVSLYLFAMFRGSNHGDDSSLEHPITSTGHYQLFYVGAPFLGAIAGLMALIPSQGLLMACNTLSLATFGATLFVWLVVDPVLGICESLTPISRQLRQQRQEENRREKQERQIKRDAILAEVAEREEQNRHEWSQQLEATAIELGELLNVDATQYQWAGRKAAKLGLVAYRLGDIRCMRLLHEMAIEHYQKTYPQQRLSDYITYWWDGIGTWHSPATE